MLSTIYVQPNSQILYFIFFIHFNTLSSGFILSLNYLKNTILNFENERKHFHYIFDLICIVCATDESFISNVNTLRSNVCVWFCFWFDDKSSRTIIKSNLGIIFKHIVIGVWNHFSALVNRIYHSILILVGLHLYLSN